MKTKLPKRSQVIKEKLEAVTQEILASAKDKIVMIILFGSYARGDWVMDKCVEGHLIYSYESDLDLLVVTKSSEYKGLKGARFASDLERKLTRMGLRETTFGKPWVTIIVDSIKHVNEQLEKSRYFHSDIKKEGILLYDSGKFTLAEAKDLNWEERKEIAQEDFEQWFPSGVEFLLGANFYFTNNMLNKTAFSLHQATESFYNAILLVFTGYKKRKMHDIEKLGSLASNYSDELLKIFPRDTKELNDRFILLQEAYIRARYDKTYKITEEELNYLISRVEKLKEVTEKICMAWISKPELDS